MAEEISQLLTRRFTLIKKLKYYRRYRQCSEDSTGVAIHSIFQKYGIKIEPYHGGQINVVYVRRLMADSEDIINEFSILFNGCSRGYVTYENVQQVLRTHAKLLHQLDGAFSCLRQVEPTRDRIRYAGSFVADSTKTWRNLGLSVTPKAHNFEYHEIESMQDINGLGYTTKDFIELYHQYGACQDIHSQGLREYKQKH